MDELRQVKDVVFENEQVCCPNLIQELGTIVDKNHNDRELGVAIRKFYLELTK